MVVSISKYVHSNYTCGSWRNDPWTYFKPYLDQDVISYLALISPYHAVERMTDDTLECMISLSTQILNPTALEMSDNLLSSVYGYLTKWLWVPWGKDWGNPLPETFVEVYLFSC